jgi:regulation of enolase protein 1 (concanavalin A-like superfamily)
VEIFNSWTNLTSVTSGGTDSLSGGVGYIMIEAAELIKSTYSGWAPTEIDAFKDMLVYPGYSTTSAPSGTKTFYWMSYQGDPGRHGNQGLSGWRTVMAMGIFLDNEIMYDRALRHLKGLPHRSDDLPYPSGPRNRISLNSSNAYYDDYKTTAGSATVDYGFNGVMTYYLWENGQSQESSRDQQHVFFGIGLIGSMAEMAWNQGEDIYSHENDRLLLGLEYSMRYNVTNSFPDQLTPWEPTAAGGEFIQRDDRTLRWYSKAINPDGRGGFSNVRPIFEIPVAHYIGRGFKTETEAKWTLRARDKAIEESGYEVAGWSNDAIGWGGLSARRPDYCYGDPVSGFSSGVPMYGMNVLPGTLEAENYDAFAINGEGHTYHDLTATNAGGAYRTEDGVDISTCSEGGYCLTSLEAGEWLTYTVAVPAAGNYDLAIRCAASASGGKVKFSFGGTDKTGEVAVPFETADWTDVTIATGVPLSKGVQSMRIDFSGSSNAFDLNSISITRDTNSLVGCWSFDDGAGSVATDSSGFGNHGTVENATWVSGADGGALDFNGSTSRVTLPVAAFDSISSEISIAMWVYGDDFQPLEDSVFYAVDGSNARVLNIHLPFSNTNVYWDAGYDSGYDRIYKTANDSVYKGKWNHWAFTKSATDRTMKIFLNGTLWHSGSGKTKIITGITAATIGSQITSASYNGLIDDIRLYNIALSDAEIQDLYQDYPINKVGEFTDQQDVGIPALAGSAAYTNGVYTVTGGGNDIYNTADNFYFVSKEHSNDGKIETQVTSVQNTDNWAKAGIMFRETTATGSKEVLVALRPDRQVTMQSRSATDGSTTSYGTFGDTINPKWIRLERSGNLFSGYYSIDGQSWTIIQSVSVSMASDILKGLAVSSHNDAALCTATLNMVPPAPTGLTAGTISADQIDLFWNPATSATAYNLKRSASSGGPFALLVGELSSTNHSDAGLSAGTNYYYVVSGEYYGVDGANSLELTAVPSAVIDPDDIIFGETEVGAGGSDLILSVPVSGLGHNYQVKSSESLVDPVWENATDVFPGNGSELLIEVPILGNQTNLYYKLEAWRQ